MSKKTREPQRLGNADYLTFYNEIVDFVAAQVIAGTYPAHLPADLADLRTAFSDSITDYNAKRVFQVDEATPAVDEATAPVYNRIRSFKQVLPTLFGGDKTVLAEFGISEPVPVDKDDLFVVAHNCEKHWLTVSDPLVNPEYIPVEPFFTAYIVEFAAFNTARAAQITATRETEDAQNLTLTTRATCNDAERLVFNWYRGLHLDPQDEWWTSSPWGASSGGGDTEQLPAPEGFNFDIPSTTGSFSAVEGAVGYTAQLTPNVEPYDWTQIYQGQDLSFVHNPGVGSWVFRVRAYNDIVGVWSALLEVVIAQ